LRCVIGFREGTDGEHGRGSGGWLGFGVNLWPGTPLSMVEVGVME